MFCQLAGIAKSEESDADIQRGVLCCSAGLVDEESCVTDGLIV